mmetsp:Transcript_19758/g.27571  ORF Transcript_19758/g.27571 Transcript_19758/m.27571 type:complete len:93 (-) Transcript_19758:17-295(-)
MSKSAREEVGKAKDLMKHNTIELETKSNIEADITLTAYESGRLRNHKNRFEVVQPHQNSRCSLGFRGKVTIAVMVVVIFIAGTLIGIWASQQ